MKTQIMKSLVLAFALAGCATIPKTEQVQLKASHDLRCEASKVKTTTIDAKTVRASGCEQEVVYVESCPFPEATRCTWVAQRDGATTDGARANVPSSSTGTSQ